MADINAPLVEELPEELRKEEILRRYKNGDGTLNTPVEEIVRIEQQWAKERHNPFVIDPRNWDGDST